MFSRSIEHRLIYIQRNLQQIQKEDTELMGKEHDVIPETQNVYLPLSFLGPKRWTSEQVVDALAIAARYRPPSFFITMTCNPNWIKIISCLKSNQTCDNILDVVVRVFKAKLYALLKVRFFICF